MCIYCDSFNKNKKDEEVRKKIFEAISDSLDLPTPSHNDEYEPYVMRRLAESGRRLFKNPKDNHALTETTKVILNQMNLAELHGDNYYEKFFPCDSKGEKKKVSFKSPFFCQTEREDFIALFLTDQGSVVRGGIQSCGKAWSCPVCGAKIAVRRNEEVKKILKKAHKMKKSVYMLTLTSPHTKKDSILDSSEKMRCALRLFWDSYEWHSIKKEYRWFGSIRCMETTLGGPNGAHNHFHIIVIFDYQIIAALASEIRWNLLAAWKKVCIEVGLLNPMNEKQLADFDAHAVDLKKDFDPDYISKQSVKWQHEMRVSANWTAAEELTLSHMKKCKIEGKTNSDAYSFTPFGFAADMAIRAALGNYSMTELAADCETFIEYACAMHGRAQIYFSNGLRAWAGLDKGKNGQGKTDAEICNEQTDHGFVIGGFDRAQHKFIRRKIAWKNIKTAIEKNGPAVLEVISKWLEKNGYGKAYSREQAKLYVKMRDGIDGGEDFDYASFEALMKELKALNNNSSADDPTIGESVRELAQKEQETQAKPEQISLVFDAPEEPVIAHENEELNKQIVEEMRKFDEERVRKRKKAKADRRAKIDARHAAKEERELILAIKRFYDLPQAIAVPNSNYKYHLLASALL